MTYNRYGEIRKISVIFREKLLLVVENPTDISICVPSLEIVMFIRDRYKCVFGDQVYCRALNLGDAY